MFGNYIALCLIIRALGSLQKQNPLNIIYADHGVTTTNVTLITPTINWADPATGHPLQSRTFAHLVLSKSTLREVS